MWLLQLILAVYFARIPMITGPASVTSEAENATVILPLPDGMCVINNTIDGKFTLEYLRDLSIQNPDLAYPYFVFRLCDGVKLTNIVGIGPVWGTIALLTKHDWSNSPQTQAELNREIETFVEGDGAQEFIDNVEKGIWDFDVLGASIFPIEIDGSLGVTPIYSGDHVFIGYRRISGRLGGLISGLENGETFVDHVLVATTLVGKLPVVYMIYSEDEDGEALNDYVERLKSVGDALIDQNTEFIGLYDQPAETRDD